MAIFIILISMYLAARGLYKHLAVSRVEKAAPELLAALMALRENVHMANRQSGQNLRDAADAAIYKALGLKA